MPPFVAAAMGAHPYLGIDLALLVLFVLGFVGFPAQRRPMVLSGLLATPFALTTPLFVPDYWTPTRVGNSWIGFEDAAHLFASGGIAWLLTASRRRCRLAVRVRAARLLKRYTGAGGAGVAVHLTLWSCGVGAMTSHLLAMLAEGMLLGWLCSGFRVLSVTGALAFGLIWFVALGLAFFLWPEFRLQWTAGNLWGPALLGVPLEEIVWACAFGAVWPFLMAYAFDARIVSPDAQGPTVDVEALPLGR